MEKVITDTTFDSQKKMTCLLRDTFRDVMWDERNIDGEYSKTLIPMLYTNPKYTLIQACYTSPT